MFSFLFADVTMTIVHRSHRCYFNPDSRMIEETIDESSLDRWTETKDIKCQERAERASAFDPLERSKWLKNVERTTSSGPSNEVTKH